VNIAVCVKRVPDTESRIKIGSDGRSIDESGVKFVMNPYDEYAVEEALQLRDKTGGGEVVVISMGADVCQETIRTELAMGADRGILLKTDTTSIDPVSIGKVLARELREGSYDLILFGKVAIDDYSYAVGNVVAELLNFPCVSAIGHLAIGEGGGTAEREVEGGVEVVEFTLPAVLTADKGLNEPRYPALRGIMMAKKKPLEVRPVELGSGGLAVMELSVPPERAEGRIVGEGADAVPALIEALRAEAKVL